MKHPLAILLLIILLIPLAGGHLLFKLRQWQIREQIEQRIESGVEKEDLVLLKIPDSWDDGSNPGFQWVEDHEFRYQGRMYDIVEQEQHGDTTYYYCIWDHEESALFAKLDEMTAQAMQHDPASKQQEQNLRQLLTNLYLSEVPLFQHPLKAMAASVTPYQFSLKTWMKRPLCPPPRS